MTTDRAVTIRPGTYERIVMESRRGERSATAWVRTDNPELLNSFVANRLRAYGGRPLYRLRVRITAYVAYP